MILIEELFIVISRSLSAGSESKYRSLPAIEREIMLLDEMRQSDKHVFPWSTCASMQKLRMRLGSFCKD